MTKSSLLKLQRNAGIFPKNYCLIAGSPRSGTTALVDWLRLQKDVSAFQESRILIGLHRFMDEIRRFKNLEKDSAKLIKLARNLVNDYYSSSRKLIGKKLLVDKEPLEPIAFPSKDYENFLINVRMVFPEVKFLFVIRDPLATIWSMSRRKWGESLTAPESRIFTLEDYIENWCSCTNLILKYKADSHAYIVRYEGLIKEPIIESKKIYKFLNIKGNPFQPRPTKEIGFMDKDREQIIRMVQPSLDLLNA